MKFKSEHRTRKKTAWLVAASLAALVPAAHAEEGEARGDTAAADPADDAADPVEIVVTAGKREQSIQDVPTAITALGEDVFTLRGVGRSASEVLALVPNASAGTQQHGRPRWWIRGVGAGQQQIDLANPVGFYLDEVYISNASATGLPLFDLERVEVLRGPQGTLWGKNTTGGAIAVVTKKPSFSPTGNENYVKLDYGSYDDKIVQAGVGFVIAPDALAARISGHIENRDGRYTNLFTGDKDNAVEDSVIRGQLLARAGGNFEALLGVHYRKYKTTGGYWTIGSYRADGIYRNGYAPPTDRDAVNTNADEFSDTEQYGGSLKLDWDFGAATLTSITGYERYEVTSGGDSDYTPLEIARNHTEARSEQWSQELRLASNGSGRLKWIVGLYYFNEKIDSDAATATLPDGTVPAQPGDTAPNAFSRTLYDHRAESGAAFANLGYDFTDTLNLTVGARFTRETKTLDFSRIANASAAGATWSNYARWWDSYTGTFGPAGTGGNFSGSLKRTWDNFTYDVTPSWRIAPDHLLYFKYAHGVKSGGFNTAAQVLAALQVVEPEKLDAFEIGYKSSWFDGALTFNATAFHYQYDNVQINVVGPNPGAVAGTTTSYLQNAEEAHVNGAEFELTARPVKGLALNAALGLLDTKYDKLQVVNGGANLSGAEFVRAPHVTLNLGASYEFELGSSGSLQLGADARYQSHQYYYITPQDRVNRFLLNQPGYTLANARVAYTTPDDRFTFTVYVSNLFDEAYRNHALPQFNAANGVSGDTIQWGDPRTWGASLVARF
ncbi:TonB-dependent receptor [Sphingomonas sp. BT-65]|uniref:TonB-dependent receptor n=1 Tax=Sphingomonas sp. BT-65 TaxID=2989821 RepID=UPI002236C030|nr:TonB-dependent receptor [Sphingomonas sp. BT-65]MCW4460226.1 TonB-dependent receptor [Sphingomonas sp. BT-65]